MMNRQLASGVAAGPLFLGVWAVQAFTRDGFDPGKHPISLLALGGAGWVQITNFVLTGSLYVVAAVGLRRAGLGVWGPRLVARCGVVECSAGAGDRGTGWVCGCGVWVSSGGR